MVDIPDGYQVGVTEHRYLEQLEQFRRKGIALTPSDFCKRVGLAGPSSIRRYKVLKAALNQYGWQTAPDRMRGSRPSLLDRFDLGPDPRIQRLEERIQRLQQQLAEAERLREQVRDAESDLNDLRGLLMAFITHFAKADATRGRDIEQRLILLMRERLPTEKVPDLVQGDSATMDAINKLLDDVQHGR